jgi:hypothetical protein
VAGTASLYPLEMAMLQSDETLQLDFGSGGKSTEAYGDDSAIFTLAVAALSHCATSAMHLIG